MGKGNIRRPSVGSAVPLPEGVRLSSVSSHGKAGIGACHVTFALDWAPEAQVDICLEGGCMVGLVVTGALSARALQRVPLRSLERAAIASLRAMGDRRLRTVGGSVGTVADLLGPLLGGRLERALGPEDGIPDDRLVRLAVFAARYVDLCGTSPTPTKDLAAEEELAPATVRDRLHQARRGGLLTSAGSGRAGGELTERARTILCEVTNKGGAG